MPITEISVIHHVAVVIFLLWLLNAFNYGRPLFYFISLVYLYQVNERYVMRLSRKFQFEQRRQSNQKRALLESESVRWLNHALEKLWPVCMEEIVSQKIFLPIIPWFLDKYKPWTVKKATVEHLYLGRKPPMFTEMRVLHESSDDDHLVLELGLNFLTADDMSAILAAKLSKRLGFGIVTKMHITSMHVEGKVLVGVKFIHDWPYISRLRICFAEPPYFQMTVKPLFNRGVDVTEIPGIAGWLDNLLAGVFEETLVEPNMLVVDMLKFVSPQPSSKPADWFSVSAKAPIAYARVEVIEGLNMKPSDLNGLADPFVKGQLGPYKFKTKIQRKTLTPKWQEEFKIPISSWESDNVLNIEVRDKDHFTDDSLGVCSIDISQFKDGQRHDIWIPLDNIKMGRLHLAMTVIHTDSKEVSKPAKDEKSSGEDKADPPEGKIADQESSGSSKNSHRFADTFEAIDFEGQEETGMWVHHPGSDAPQTKELRKGKSRRLSDTKIKLEFESIVSTPKESSTDSPMNHKNCAEHGQGKKRNIFSMGVHMMNDVFHGSQKKKDPIPSSDDQQSLIEAQEECMEKSAHQIERSLYSKGVKNSSRTCEEEAKDIKVNDVSESSDEDSVLDERFLEGVPITSNEATNDDTMNLNEKIIEDAHDPPEVIVEAYAGVASKNL